MMRGLTRPGWDSCTLVSTFYDKDEEDDINDNDDDDCDDDDDDNCDDDDMRSFFQEFSFFFF